MMIRVAQHEMRCGRNITPKSYSHIRKTHAGRSALTDGTKVNAQSNYILLIDCIVAAFVTFDLVRTLRTGRAHTWMHGTVTRKHQSFRYWRA
jgi:hypothetical protein